MTVNYIIGFECFGVRKVLILSETPRLVYTVGSCLFTPRYGIVIQKTTITTQIDGLGVRYSVLRWSSTTDTKPHRYKSARVWRLLKRIANDFIHSPPLLIHPSTTHPCRLTPAPVTPTPLHSCRTAREGGRWRKGGWRDYIGSWQTAALFCQFYVAHEYCLLKGITFGEAVHESLCLKAVRQACVCVLPVASVHVIGPSSLCVRVLCFLPEGCPCVLF